MPHLPGKASVKIHTTWSNPIAAHGISTPPHQREKPQQTTQAQHVEFFGAGACLQGLMEGCRRAHRKQPSVPQQRQPGQDPAISGFLSAVRLGSACPRRRGRGSERKDPSSLKGLLSRAGSVVLQSYLWCSQYNRSP